MKIVQEDGSLNKRKLSTLLIIVLILAQIAYGLINVSMFRTAYLQIVQENTALTGDIIRKTIEKVSGLGVPYTDLVGIDDWLGKIVQSINEIERIDLADAANKVLYSTAPAEKRTAAHEAYSLARPLKEDATGAKAAITVIISEAYVKSRIFNLALDAVTMLVTSIFFMVEAIVFMGMLLRRQMSGELKGLSKVEGLLMDKELESTGFIRNMKAVAAKEEDDSVRPLAFLVLLAGYMSISFIPILMKDLYEPLFGLSQNVVLGLPIAAEMFGAFLSSLFIGHAIDKRGWRPPFMAGILVMGIGTAVSALVWSALSFIFARMIVGVGYGAAWMGLRGLVASGQTGEERTKGFSILNAGIFAGQNCGAVLGAMLAERMGFPRVFVLATAVVIWAGFFALLFVKNVRPAGADTPGPSTARIKGFFSDGRLIAFFLLITIPSAIAGTFLNYFFPLYAKSIGVTQGNVGRAFLVYGICIIFVGPFLIKKLGKRFTGRQIMTAAGLIGVLALAAFCSKATFAGAVVAIILLGVSDSIGLVSQNSYFINLPAAQTLGHGKALSFFSAIKKVGQMLGPGAFGWAAALGAVTGVAVIAGGYLAATGAFVFLTRGAPRNPKGEEIQEVEG
jgi:MFS family permease